MPHNVKTDSIVYPIFQAFPSFFFELIDRSPEDAIASQFTSVEIKQLGLSIEQIARALELEKDDYIPQCMYLVAAIRERFTSAGYSIPYGFQNHPFLFTQWTQPPADSVATKIGRGSRKHVLIYGRISFTIDNSETLGDQNCEQREIIEEESNNAIAVAFTPMFNDDDGFADCMKALIIDVMQGGRDIKDLG